MGETTEPMTYRVYLDTGAVIEFQADNMTKAVSRITGKLETVEWSNVTGNAPRYLDADRIVAITRQVERSAE